MVSRPSARLLWFDGLAGLSAGVVVLAAHRMLAAWYGLSEAFVIGLGVVNLCYAPFGITLAVRARRPLLHVSALALANIAWAVVCFGLAAAVAGEARPLGVGMLVFEGLFVGGLGAWEWRARRALAHELP